MKRKIDFTFKKYFMERVIKKFNSFEEQELWHLECIAKFTPVERLKRLRTLQELSKKMKPTSHNIDRKIIKRNGFI